MQRSPFFGMPKLGGKERDEALSDPGPTWKEYFEREFLRWCWALLIIIVDVWIIATFLAPLDVPAMLATLVGATYLEFVGYRYLWYRPDPDAESLHSTFVRTWTRPRRFGVFTPEAERQKAGLSPFPPGQRMGPDPSEFL
ncbi:MAG: hypothetical protein L3K07_08130 [Thermoplasmata archaeon]|nr:hypothetical protein [Thermoplasmata archaeon]